MPTSRIKNILVTGGAGFIGSFLVDELIKRDYAVRIFDNLETQVHQRKKPLYLNPKAEFIRGDVRNREALRKAIRGCDVVFHLAAAVGVGQSMYEIKKYVDVNVGGTANLLDIVVRDNIKLKKLVVPSSMTCYGEGMYRCSRHGAIRCGERPEFDLRHKQWEPRCPRCRSTLFAISTKEGTPMALSSVYALTKRAQEDLTLTTGGAYGIPVAILRLFNVYGPRQSLSNPYTGVTAIFLNRLKNNHEPLIYEDGNQSRDFVSVHDVVDAMIRAMKSSKADGQVFNVGSGQATSIKHVAESLARLLGKNIKPRMAGTSRRKDIRHCTADISNIARVLGWKPKVSFERGMKELIAWAAHESVRDHFDRAAGELKKKGLTR